MTRAKYSRGLDTLSKEEQVTLGAAIGGAGGLVAGTAVGLPAVGLLDGMALGAVLEPKIYDLFSKPKKSKMPQHYAEGI